MKTIVLFGLMLVLAVICGCAVILPPPATATQTFTYEINEMSSSDEDINSEEINLFTEEDYVDNRENIISVDQVTFVGTVTNYTGSTIQFFLFADAEEDSDYTTLEEIAAYATPVFTIPLMLHEGDIPIEINWADAAEWMENPEFLANLIINDGRFRIYAIGSEAPFELVTELTVIITVTVTL